MSWGDLARSEPELADFGRARLVSAPAYLATSRRSGAPRVHPVTPVFAEDELYVFMEPNSPKGTDLRDRGWFSLHNGVPDNAGSGGEFSLSGIGVVVEDPDIWTLAADSATYEPAPRYVLFELRLTEARCNGYGDVVLPLVQRWSTSPGGA